jgi:hypothetical protein
MPAGASLLVRGRAVMKLSGRDAIRRLSRAARRLDPLLPPPTAVTVQTTRRVARLLVDGQVVLEMTRADAAKSGVSLAQFARDARAALEAALAVPPIVLSRSGLVLSPGHTEAVQVNTILTTPLIAGAFDRRVVDVRLDQQTVWVTGKTPGNTTIPLRAGPYSAQLAVSVRPPAGKIPSQVEVIVTGSPAPAELIRAAVARGLEGAVTRDPGALMELREIPVSEPLPPGGWAAIPVGVRVRSPYAGPVDGIVRVMVRNIPVSLGDPDVLLVSNRPESITGNGLLFQDALAPGRPARLLYHHSNGSPTQTRVLKITLTNPGGVRARVHYLSGHAGPSSDPLAIGYVSTARFLEAMVGSRGYVVEIPPHGTTTFTAYALPPQALVSGLMQFQVIEGGFVELTVHVRVPWLLDRTVTTDLGPWAFPHPRGTFPGSVVEIARDVAVDQPAALADLGVMSNLRDTNTGDPLVGDYGVLYRVRLRLINPTDREITAGLVATAAGGPARGLFLVDGSAVNAGLMRPAEDRELTAFTMPAGARRDVVILTMPVAGSFYPVRLVVRPR